MIVIDSTTWNHSPEQILENYPRLTLSQIHAALAYYYEHQASIDAQIAQENEKYEQIRAAHPNPLTRKQVQERWQ